MYFVSKKRRHEELEASLTFSNPTYSASGGDGLPPDRKVWPWKNQHNRGNKKQVWIFKTLSLYNILSVMALFCKYLRCTLR